jgi:hypothetical protein
LETPCSVRACADWQKEIADFASTGGLEHFICLRDLFAAFFKKPVFASIYVALEPAVFGLILSILFNETFCIVLT